MKKPANVVAIQQIKDEAQEPSTADDPERLGRSRLN